MIDVRIETQPSRRFLAMEHRGNYQQMYTFLVFGWLAVLHMNAELDVARIASARIEAVTPLKPRLALGAGGTGVVLNHGGFEDGARSLRRLEAYAPFAGAVGFLVSDEGVIAVDHSVVGVHIGEVLIGRATGNVGGCFDELGSRGCVHGCLGVYAFEE